MALAGALLASFGAPRWRSARCAPELVAEITYLSWTDGGLLPHPVLVGLREDKPVNEVRRKGLGL